MNAGQMDSRDNPFSIIKGLTYLHILGVLSAESELKYEVKTKEEEVGVATRSVCVFDMPGLQRHRWLFCWEHSPISQDP